MNFKLIANIQRQQSKVNASSVFWLHAACAARLAWMDINYFPTIPTITIPTCVYVQPVLLVDSPGWTSTISCQCAQPHTAVLKEDHMKKVRRSNGLFHVNALIVLHQSLPSST